MCTTVSIDKHHQACDLHIQIRFSKSPGEYAASIVTKLAPMLREVDATVELLPVAGSNAWNTAWFRAFNDSEIPGGTNNPNNPLMVATSFHGGYDNIPGGTPTTRSEFEMAAKHPTAVFLAQVAAQRHNLDAVQQASGSAQHTPVGLSLDEWGLGYPWLVEEFNVAHGMYGASFLGGVLRNAKRLGVAFTNYFEPVNEGAVEVREFDAILTPLGEVMALFAHHQNNTRLILPSDTNMTADLDFTASIGSGSHFRSGSGTGTGSKTGTERGDGDNDGEEPSVLLLHVANRNPDTAYELVVSMRNLYAHMRIHPNATATKNRSSNPKPSATAKFALLSPTELPLTPSTIFDKTEGTVKVQDGKLQARVPAYGVLEVAVPLVQLA